MGMWRCRNELIQPSPAPIHPAEIHQCSKIIYGMGDHRCQQVSGPNPQEPQICPDERCDDGVGPGEQMCSPKHHRSQNQRQTPTHRICQAALNSSSKERLLRNPGTSEMANNCRMDQLPKSGRSKDSINCLCRENTCRLELRVQRKTRKGGMAATIPMKADVKLQ